MLSSLSAAADTAATVAAAEVEGALRVRVVTNEKEKREE